MADETQRVGTRLWFACSAPEKPTDPYVIWHYNGCNACRLKAQAVARMHPDIPRLQIMAGLLAEDGE